MICSSILMVYGAVSLLGSIIFLFKGSAVSNQSTLSISVRTSMFLFILCHFLLIVAAVYHAYKSLSWQWFIGCYLICIISRWINGQVLSGRSNWQHYVVVSVIFGAASLSSILL